MPDVPRLRPPTSSRRHARGWRAATLLVVATATAFCASASAIEPRPSCGAPFTVEAALQRLNEVRVRGAICHAGAMTTAAPLAWSESLAVAARTQAGEMARLHRMGHLDSRNRGLADRLRAIGYRFSLAVENVGVGYASAADAVDAWLDSEGHCENLMNARVLEVGLACIDDGASSAPAERRYWTLVLGAPSGSR